MSYDVLLPSLGTSICLRLPLSSLISNCFSRCSFGMTVQPSLHHLSSIISDIRLPLCLELVCGPLTADPKKALLFKKDTDAALDYTLGEQPFNGHPPPMAPVMSAFSCVAEKV